MTDVAVLKFGGTSVKSIARMQHVCDIIAASAQQKPTVVVVSAMGDTTDYLVKLAKQASPSPDKREYDLLLSTGEQISIALVAMMLRNMGVKARSFTGQQVGIFTETVHTKARIVDIKADTLVDALKEHDVIVVAGFQGVTESGDITTLGRGGSDTTAVALAAAIGAPICDIYTDVDGIYTADPNAIKGARKLQRISYGEVLELARMGAQVLHPRSVELGRQYGVKLRVRNTFKPENEGTVIDDGGDQDMEIFRTISGVAVDKDQAVVAIMDVPDQPGIAAKITQALADENIIIDMIMQSFHPSIGLNNINFTVGDSDLDQTIAVLKTLKEKLKAKEVIADPDIAKVSLVGAGLSGQPQIPAKLFSVLGAAGINIKMIASSEMKITCVVAREDAGKAAQLIHDAFELEGAVKK
jgi:aspartate kinase